MWSLTDAGQFGMFRQGAEAGCHVFFSGGAGRSPDGGVGHMDEFLERSNTDRRHVTTICDTCPSRALFGFAKASPFGTPAWKAPMALPTIADRVAALRDPATGA